MAPNTPVDENALRRAIATARPDLHIDTLTLLNDGWDSVAVDIDDTWIFKFPKHADAATRLRMEAGLLAFLAPRLTMPVPRMTLYEGEPLFSGHCKLHGSALVTADYRKLSESQRDAVAEAMAQFYAELHAIPLADAEAAGARPIGAWMTAEEVIAEAAPLLPSDLVPFLQATMAEFASIPADADETVYGFFDGHGWNMAFDHEAGKLNGVFDFADSGFGERHKDLTYSNFIARDLTLRTIARYRRLTGRAIDRDRVMLYAAAQRLWELAAIAKDPEHLPAMLQSVQEWATGGP